MDFIIFSLQNATVRHFLAFWASKSLKSRFKLQLALRTASGSDLGPQNGPNMAPKSTPRGSQDAPGARLPLEAVFVFVLASFLDPLEPQESSSRLGAVLVLAKIAPRAREPKIDSKMTPKSTPIRPPEASKWPKMSPKSAPRF